MIQIELLPEEGEVLTQIVQNALATLELEIGHTDHQEFKALLKRRREILRGLIVRLPQPAAAAA
jgi:hypothetical protein